MPSSCNYYHVLVQKLGDDSVVYPIGTPAEAEHLVADELVRGLVRPSRPSRVFMDCGRLNWNTVSAFLAELVRLGRRVHELGGRLILFNLRAQTRDFLEQIYGQFPLDLFNLRSGESPGREHILPDPAWLAWNGGAVEKLARAIYRKCRFEDLPLLADALEEAGCTNEDILSHCRSGGKHISSCWVLALLVDEE
jgi:hypothetical protein